MIAQRLGASGHAVLPRRLAAAWIRRDCAPFATCDGSLRHVNGRQNFRAGTFALFPQGKRFLYGVLLAVKASAFNSLADKCLLIGGKVFHAILRVGGRRASVNGDKMGTKWGLAPAPFASPLCRCGGILRGDERIAFIVKARAFLCLSTYFKQLISDVFNAVAPLRGHEAPEEIRHAAIWPLPLP
jgi:hypothetical protein